MTTKAAPPLTPIAAGNDLGAAEISPTSFEGKPSPAALAEMITVERAALLEARAGFGEFSRSASAHEAILRLLIERAQEAAPAQRRPAPPLEVALAMADIFHFDVPASRRGSRLGKAVTGTKRLLMGKLKSFHIETLRPQAEFNRALVDVLRSILGSQSGSREWVRQRLGSLADPTAWQVRSHRNNVTGQLAELTKKSYLKAAGPVLIGALAGQGKWNEAMICVLEAWATPGADDGHVSQLMDQLEALNDPLASASDSKLVQATLFVWTELLRRQVQFNQFVFQMLQQVARQPRAERTPYATGVQKREEARVAHLAGALADCGVKPSFSLVLAPGDAPPAALERTVQTVGQQLYGSWELILVCDPRCSKELLALAEALAGTEARIRVVSSPAPGLGAARNQLTGDFFGFLEAGDLLAPNALGELVLALAADPSLELIYSDEDRLEAGTRASPFFKPDFSPALLLACDFLSHFLVIRADVFDAAGGLTAAVEGAELYDLGWRAAERTKKIGHVAEVLYTRGVGSPSRAADFLPAAGPQVLEAHLKRVGSEAKVSRLPAGFRVQHRVVGSPLVSIIVPFKDKPELLQTLVRSLEQHTAYPNYELLLISNNSVEPQTFALLKKLHGPKIRHLTWNHPFNYPAINNFGAREAKGELLLFLNNDIELIEPDWLTELASQALREDVGAVGAKLLFPNRTLQHAGVVVGMGGFAGHIFAGLPDDGAWTPFGTADWTRNYLALTSACLMIRRSLFKELGGYDEKFLLCGSDVDLCLRTVQAGKQVLYTPHAVLLHHESATRRDDRIPANDFWESFRSYRPYLLGDPFYNPHLSLARTEPSLREPGEPTALDTALQVLGGQDPLLDAHGLSGGRLAYSKRVIGMAEALDFGSADLGSASRPRAASTAPPRQITWLLPYFDHPFGGVHTILRFADLWRRQFGVENTFVIYDNPHVTARELEAKVAMIFDELPGKFEILKSKDHLRYLPPCDVCISTLWSGAYFALRYKKAQHCAYFVQDFEPQFYAAGTLGALAENTYRMNFYGIFNSQGLHDFVTANYPMKGTWFEPSVDHELFHATGRKPPTPRVRVFFYGRPSTDRNAFELGIEALRKVKERFGDEVEIFSAGEIWNPAWFKAEGILENLGILPYRETANLYRSTDIGLVFMFTKHPSYLPLELMACGVTVVTNDNPANRWLLKHRENSLLFQPTATCAAEQLIEAVENEQLREQLGRAAAERMHATNWAAQARKAYEALSRHVLA